MISVKNVGKWVVWIRHIHNINIVKPIKIHILYKLLWKKYHILQENYLILPYLKPCLPNQPHASSCGRRVDQPAIPGNGIILVLIRTEVT